MVDADGWNVIQGYYWFDISAVASFWLLDGCWKLVGIEQYFYSILSIPFEMSFILSRIEHILIEMFLKKGEALWYTVHLTTVWAEFSVLWRLEGTDAILINISLKE